MISEDTAHKGINIGFHMVILCIFLTILFFTYISKREENVISKEFSKAINENVPSVLNSIDKFDKEILPPHGNINWKDVDKIADKIEDKYKDKDPEVIKNNKKLLLIAIIMCVILAIITISGILYFGVYKGYNLHLKVILMENAVIAVFIGIIEILFFQYIASEYVPVNKSQLADNLINRIEYNINNQIK